MFLLLKFEQSIQTNILQKQIFSHVLDLAPKFIIVAPHKINFDEEEGMGMCE
jgi:hypothetical protein